MNAAFLSDGYKYMHAPMFPAGITKVYNNFTPRSNKHAPKGCNEIVVFGTTLAWKQIHEEFATNFFMTEARMILADHPKRIKELKNKVISEIKTELSLYMGSDYDTSYFEALWDLGYLPIKVKTLEEGTISPIKVPIMTVTNTHPDFFWLPNFLETIVSNLMWKPVTSATIAYQYKKLLTKWALKTDEKNVGFVNFQGHDFSMRGMDSIGATISSGLGHLTSFQGTDSVPSILGARKYYGETGFVAGSVPATEHSIMCAGSKEGELETFRRLMKTFPTGILSVVSDTWDLWYVITSILVELKDEILARDGKLVIRPDSGDPVDIICGTMNRDLSHCKLGDDFHEDGSWGKEGNYRSGIDFKIIPEHKGVIELLWDIFGGTVNDQGYKVLNPCIGAIYGDSITLERAEEICKRLEVKGFASTNIVLGIGSFTYQYNTRDSFGFAVKATYVEKSELTDYSYSGKSNGSPIYETIGYPIFKDPVTDDGTKKSATGLLRVTKKDDKLTLKDNCTWEEESTGMLKILYQDGVFHGTPTLTQIREKLNKYGIL